MHGPIGVDLRHPKIIGPVTDAPHAAAGTRIRAYQSGRPLPFEQTDTKAAWNGDGTGAVTPPKAPQPETTSKLMRRIHDGTGTGPVWQLIIFLGGIIPAALAVTGILMWFNRRRRRALSRGRWAAG
jgi:hypothetical protein